MKLLLPLLLASMLMATSCKKDSDAPGPGSNSKITKSPSGVEAKEGVIVKPKPKKPYYEAVPKERDF